MVIGSLPRRSRGAAPERGDDVQTAAAGRSDFGFTCVSIGQVGCLVNSTCGWMGLERLCRGVLVRLLACFSGVGFPRPGPPRISGSERGVLLSCLAAARRGRHLICPVQKTALVMRSAGRVGSFHFWQPHVLAVLRVRTYIPSGFKGSDTAWFRVLQDQHDGWTAKFTAGEPGHAGKLTNEALPPPSR